jgi:hypothetical protein
MLLRHLRTVTTAQHKKIFLNNTICQFMPSPVILLDKLFVIELMRGIKQFCHHMSGVTEILLE